jgi:hypothetical protein
MFVEHKLKIQIDSVQSKLLVKLTFRELTGNLKSLPAQVVVTLIPDGHWLHKRTTTINIGRLET